MSDCGGSGGHGGHDPGYRIAVYQDYHDGWDGPDVSSDWIDMVGFAVMVLFAAALVALLIWIAHVTGA